MNQPTDMFGMLLADMATRITRQAVQADPLLSARLVNLQGNVIELQCTLPPATWHIQIDDGTLRTVAGPAQAPQAIVRGSIVSLTSWLLPGENSSSVEIAGDNTLLLELADILRSFSPDIEAPLRNVLGADLTTSLVGGAEAGLNALQSLLEGAGKSVSDQATRPFLRQPQLASFLDGVDALRLRVDRLAARINAVEKARSAAPNNGASHGR